MKIPPLKDEFIECRAHDLIVVKGIDAHATLGYVPDEFAQVFAACVSAAIGLLPMGLAPQDAAIHQLRSSPGRGRAQVQIVHPWRVANARGHCVCG